MKRIRGFMVGPVLAALVAIGGAGSVMVSHPQTVDTGPVYHNYNGGFTK